VARTVLEVFLSSTAADLKPHRDAVYARLARIEFFKCIRQEDFGAQNAEAMQYCCDKARAADLFVGMIGLRRGWEPHGDNSKRSITEMEYDCAKEVERARYLWVSPNDFPVPGNLRESDGEHERQLAFRKRVMSGGERIVSQKGFASPDALASEIVEQLLAHVVTGDLIKLLRPELAQSDAAPIEDQKPAIAAAVEKLAADEDVDLLSLARNPHGVDLADLEAKLKARAETHEAASRDENNLAAEYWRHIGALAFLHNTQKAFTAYKRAMALDPNNHMGWYRLGQLHFRLGNLDAAHASFDSAIRVAEQTSDQQGAARGQIWKGWVYQSQGNLADAEANTLTALQLAESAEWKSGAADAYGNLGEIHRLRGDLEKAKQMQLKALAIAEERADKHGIARAHMHLGLVQQAQGDSSSAEKTYRKALAFYEEIDNKEGIAAAYGNLGLIYKARGDLDEAEEAQRKSLTLNEELGSKAGIAAANWNLALVFQARGDYRQLCECLRQARDLCRDLGLQDRLATLEQWMKQVSCPEV
jgi:tetratricopeptide (TPR) repeat protein